MNKKHLNIIFVGMLLVIVASFSPLFKGFFQPFLLVAYNVYQFILKRESNFIKWIIWLDNHINMSNYSYFFFLKAVKKKG